MRAVIYMVIGAILAVIGIWWITVAGHTVQGILAGLLTAGGIAVFGAGIAVALDMYAPTSKKL